MEELIKLITKNKEEAKEIFDHYYDEKAREEGEDMMYDTRFGYDEENDEPEDSDPISIYENYAHCCGHSANYEGACGVIKHYMTDEMGVDEDDEDLQIEVMNILDRELPSY